MKLSAADESAAERLVCEDGLAEISAAVQMDPNGRDVAGEYLYFEVLYGINTLYNILVAENYRHVARVREEGEILTGIRMNILSLSHAFCKILSMPF